jgi:hypothetical protein
VSVGAGTASASAIAVTEPSANTPSRAAATPAGQASHRGASWVRIAGTASARTTAAAPYPPADTA